MTNGIGLSIAILVAAPLFAQEGFDSADGAAQTLIDAAAKHDTARLMAIFGPNGHAILTSGNAEQDRSEQAEFAKLAEAKHHLVADSRSPNRMILYIGDDDWPFPVPLIRSDGKWSFDCAETKVEMQARKIGTHELDAIEVCTGFVEVERKYAAGRHGQNGMMVYAAEITKLAEGGDVPQQFAEAAWNEHKGTAKPYHGYYFRILDGQGPNAPGGAHTYLANNKLMGGFGLVAWPAQYGVTGIQTFIVNQDGIVYQKDIAPPPGGTPVPITRYDPDPSWKPAE